VNLKAVQDILGHSDITVTQQYTRTYAGNLYEEMLKVLE